MERWQPFAGSRNGSGGVGAIVVDTGGTLTRLNIPESLYITELLGLLFIFTGFYFSNRPAKKLMPRPEEIAIRRKKVTQWGVSAGVIFLFGLVISLPILPWTMGIVTDAKHVYTDNLPADNRGAYLFTSLGVMQLYSWYVEPEEFPQDAPILDVTSFQSVAVVQKQFDVPDNYRLYDMTTAQIVPWKSFQKNGMQMILTPGSLSPGDYELVAPTDSMFGGDTMHFFSLQ